MALKLLPATLEGVKYISKHARKADRKEWFIGSDGMLLHDAVALCMHQSLGTPSRMVEDEFGHVLAMWGVGPTGNAWMLCTEGAVDRVHEMHRFFRRGIIEMHTYWHTLTAWSHKDNHVHHLWMERFGFRRGPIAHRLFYQFTRTETPH